MPDLSKDPNAKIPSVKRPDTPLAETPAPMFEFTQRYEKTKQKQDANEKTGAKPSGLDVKDGVAKAKPYEKKFIPASDKKSNASIVDAGGKTIKTSISGSQSSRDNLRRDFVSDSTDTMNRRNKNANYYNVSSGSKKNLTDADKKTLLSMGKAKNS
jgi:hypothetical protein